MYLWALQGSTNTADTLCKGSHIVSGYCNYEWYADWSEQGKGRERASQGKEPGMGNNTTFLKTQTVVTDWCNS